MKQQIKNIKDFIKPKAHWFIHNDGTSFIIAFVILFLFSIYLYIKESKILNWFDYTILVTLMLAICINFGSIFLSRLFNRYLEDDMKLTNDYNGLIKKYSAHFIKTNNSLEEGVMEKNLKKVFKLSHIKYKGESDFLLKLPVSEVQYLYDKNIKINDSFDSYDLPKDLSKEVNHVFKAHATSKIYNQLNIRVKDWYFEKNEFVISTMRTTFYDSLLTNRAMDYRWTNGMTNRDKYCYGPFIPKLSKSLLSNHLGFNGFLESNDGYIPFVKRGKNVSIAKNTYAPGIAASLKTKYALNDNKEFTPEYLKNAMLKEVMDELKVSKEDLCDFNLKESIIYAYRDLVEGGKPQFLIYFKSNKGKDEITSFFTNNIKRKKKTKVHKKYMEVRMLEDGTKIMWIHKSRLNEIAFSHDCFVFDGKEYKMVPSALASVIMLRNHLNKIESK